MGGMASIVAFLIGGKIANSFGRQATFVMGSTVMLIAVIVLFVFVKEKDNRIRNLRGELQAREKAADKPKSALSLNAFKALPHEQKRNLLLILLAIFFWFCGYNAVETFFTTFAVQHLGVAEGSAAMLLAFFSVSFVAFAIPSGFIATRIGRRRAIMIGLIGLTAVFIPINLVMNITAIRVLLLIGGFFWAMININSLPMVLEIGQKDGLGTYTGYYYLFSFSAAIASPILFGLIRDLTDSFTSLFIYAPVAFAAALVCILLFRDPKKTEA